MYESEQELLQYVLKELVEECGYSQKQIGVQVKVPGGLVADCVVYADERKKQPLVVVEVKKRILYPLAVEQLATYMKRLGASHGMLTDGVKKLFFIPFGKELIEVSSIPAGEGVMFHDILSDMVVSPREVQLPADLSYRLQNMFNFIRSNEKLAPESVVEEIHKLILCKVAKKTTNASNRIAIRLFCSFLWKSCRFDMSSEPNRERKYESNEK